MTLRSRPYLHYAPVPGGVYFGGSRNQFVLKGPPQLFKIADVCVPLLDAGTDEDELVRALGGERSRPVVARVLQALRQQDLLLDLDRLTVPAPPDEDRRRYAESLAYAESCSDDPYAAFARVRSAHVVVCGPPEVVLPAARGLARAGVGRLTLASSDPAAVAAFAGRVGAATIRLSAGAVSSLAPDAVIWCAESAPPAGAFPLVPVWLGNRVAVAGPPDGRAVPVLRQRAERWAEDERLDPVAQPAGAALAGALAGQLVFDLLCGLDVAGDAHVLHGDELSVDRITVRTPDRGHRPDAGHRLLEAARPEPTPVLEETPGQLEAVTGRWTGILSWVAAPTLPQLPLAYAGVEHRADRSGRFVGWGDNQQEATVHAALACLRDRCDGPGVGAAGLSEERWLLDGALRLLVGQARDDREAGIQELDARGWQLWQALADLRRVPLRLRLLRVPGLDWPIGSVEATDSAASLGAAWGCDLAQALRGAAAGALARTQLDAAGEDGRTGSGVNTDALVFADAPAVAHLRGQVVALLGGACAGRPPDPDAVLGDPALWFGPVHLDGTDD
jgi:hypothetical protein